MTTQADLFGETHAERAGLVRQPQQQAVLDLLLEAYPGPVSGAWLSEQVGTNKVAHRIAELENEGWHIEGAGKLPLDEESRTQLYRLASPFCGDRRIRHLGFTVRWDDGDPHPRVSVHKECNGAVTPTRLQALAGCICRLLAEECPGLAVATGAIPEETIDEAAKTSSGHPPNENPSPAKI